MDARKRFVAALLIFSLAMIGLEASAEQAPQADGEKAAQPIKDQRALDILKRMSDTLSKAKTVSFRSKNMVPIEGPGGVWISLYDDARVVMQAPDKLFIETRGDSAPLDYYYNGKTITTYVPDNNLYADKTAPATIDEVIEAAYDEDGKSFPYADLLVSDPYAVLTENLLNAIYAGQSDIGGVKTYHLVFSHKDVEWQIWIGVDNNLPFLIVATYLDEASEPSYTTELKEWKLNEPVDESTFVFQNTTKAEKVEYKNPAIFNPDVAETSSKK